MQTDVLVIGAGPAGSTLAHRLAQGGREVLVLEKARLPRHKTCGGGLPARTLAALGVDVRPVLRATVAAVALDGAFSGRQVYPIVPGAAGTAAGVVDRAELDAFLLRQAVAAGASVHEACRARSVTRTAAGFEVETTAGVCRCRCVCACDGANSLTARALGFPRNRLGFCVEGRVACAPDLGADARSSAIFNPAILKTGYAWAFPCGAWFDVGIGGCLPKAPKLVTELRRFVARTPELAQAQLTGIRGGMLPDFETPRAAYVDGGAYLVGDAAGLVDPLTGEGIFFAVSSAQQAAAAILAGDGRLYEQELRRTLLPKLVIARHYARRFRATPVWLRRAGMGLGRARQYARHFAALLLGQSSYGEMYRAMHGGRRFPGAAE